MLVDTNLLLFATNENAPEHGAASSWLTAQLGGERRVGLAWESLTAFLRVSTNPRVLKRPLDSAEAWGVVSDWLASPTVWVPVATDRHADVMGRLVSKYRLTGNLISDAQLAALAIEHGLEICSADTDFARFTEVRWCNPLADPGRA